MGEAKRRGTLEERKAMAVQKPVEEKTRKLREITINGLSKSQINLANLGYGKGKVKLHNSKIGKLRKEF